MLYLNLLVKGFFIGIANIIPGMSGGTLALVLGIYERLIKALHNIGVSTAQKLLRVVTLKGEAISDARAELRRIDFVFLLFLGMGAIVAVVVSSELMVYLLREQHDPTYGFFSGLILLSILIPIRMVRRFNLKALISLVIATALTIGLSVGMGERNLEKEREKERLQTSEILNETHDSKPTESPEKPSVSRLVYLFVCGAVAISAMILPGISGSFMLLLFGVYFDILAAISDRDLLVLAVFALGCGIGLLVFTRLLNYVLERYHDLTVSFLIGLMVGSLYGLWPFRSYEIIDGERIDIAHIMPEFNINLLITVLAFFVGCGVILLFSRFEKTELA